MNFEIYKENGKWIIKNKNGQIFKSEDGSSLEDINIIDLATTLMTFQGIKVSVDWTKQ